MMTKEDIARQMTKRSEEAYSRPYTGRAAFPDDIIDVYKKAVMAHSYSGLENSDTQKIKQVAGKRHDDLSIIEVGWVINVIFSTPFDKLFASFEEAMDWVDKLNEVREEYKVITTAIQKELIRQQDALLKIAGIKGAVPMNKGIIAEA